VVLRKNGRKNQRQRENELHPSREIALHFESKSVSRILFSDLDLKSKRRSFL